VDVQDPVQLLISGTAAHAAMVNGKLYYKNANVEGANGTSPFHTLPKKLPEPLYQFLDAVNGKNSGTLVTPGEAAARVVVMEAMYKAARTRSWVAVG
jgi:predicted dehydrogenase